MVTSSRQRKVTYGKDSCWIVTLRPGLTPIQKPQNRSNPKKNSLAPQVYAGKPCKSPGRSGIWKVRRFVRCKGSLHPAVLLRNSHEGHYRRGKKQHIKKPLGTVQMSHPEHCTPEKRFHEEICLEPSAVHSGHITPIGTDLTVSRGTQIPGHSLTIKAPNVLRAGLIRRSA
jgi:hypothetical protein